MLPKRRLEVPEKKAGFSQHPKKIASGLLLLVYYTLPIHYYLSQSKIMSMALLRLLNLKI
jgi:hypothetical protein